MQKRILKKLQRRIRSIDMTRKRVDAAAETSNLLKCDIDTLYEGLFIRAITSFEDFIGELFVEILRNKTTYPSSRVSPHLSMLRPTYTSRVLIQSQSRQYIDWLPYDLTIKRAKSLLRKGRPFTELSSDDLSILRELIVIRNAIAHSSKHANKRFNNEIVLKYSMPPRERTPVAFLRSIARINPEATRFEILIGELGLIAKHLT